MCKCADFKCADNQEKDNCTITHLKSAHLHIRTFD